MQIGKCQATSASFIPMSSYETSIINGYLSITKQSYGNKVVCTDSELEELVSETATLAKLVVESKDLIDFYAPYHPIPHVSTFLSLPDFFEKNPKHLITQVILEYHHKYGIPFEDPIENPFVDSADPPEKWLHSFSDVTPEDDYEGDYTETVEVLLREKAYPIVLTLAYLCDFYNLFVEPNEESELAFETLHLSVSFEHTYSIKDGMNTFRATKPGYWNAAYVAALAVCLGGSSIGICKHCLKGFVKTRPNVEYCSSKCRNSYNVKMSTRRHKLIPETFKSRPLVLDSSAFSKK